jgi:hypothetical protein
MTCIAHEINFHQMNVTANSQQPTANSQQPTANSQQPTANSQQPTANSQLYTSAKQSCQLSISSILFTSRYFFTFHTRRKNAVQHGFFIRPNKHRVAVWMTNIFTTWRTIKAVTTNKGARTLVRAVRPTQGVNYD